MNIHIICICIFKYNMYIYITHTQVQEQLEICPRFVRSHESNFYNTVLFWRMCGFLRVFGNRVIPQKKIKIEGMTRFKKEKSGGLQLKI